MTMPHTRAIRKLYKKGTLFILMTGLAYSSFAATEHQTKEHDTKVSAAAKVSKEAVKEPSHEEEKELKDLSKKTTDSRSSEAVVKKDAQSVKGTPVVNQEQELAQKIAARLAQMKAQQASRMKERERVTAQRVAAEKRHREQALGKVVKKAEPEIRPLNQAVQSDWSYEGEFGPEYWASLNKAWSLCSTGQRQSPIDIRDGLRVNLESIQFDYHPISFAVMDNGHTIAARLGYGSAIRVQSQQYDLVDIHFHRPSEERINGRGAEMAVHLVHRDPQGRIAVVAALFKRGKSNDALQLIWNDLPLEKHQEVMSSVVLDPMGFLPAKQSYYTYMGSLTEPPCSENVLWMVMKEPIEATPAQMALFSRLYPLNARPIQPGFGRMIKESNE